MKDFLSFSDSEKKQLKIGLLILGAILFVTNIKPAYQGISQLPIWQKKPRQAELSPNFKPPLYYEGELNDLGMARFVSLRVLVPIYKKVGEFELSQTDIDDIHQGVELAREFFWRNSRLQLHIEPTFLEVEAKMTTELLDEEGKIWPKSGILEEDLLARGIKKNQYDVVFLFYPLSHKATEDVAPLRPIGGSGSGMKLKRLGKTAYSFASLPAAETANIYPDGPKLTWIFVSQLFYSINTAVYGYDSEKLEDWGAVSSTLKQFRVQDPPKAYGRIYLTLDNDRDGVPDDEPMVPLYEVHLGQNKETNDSDGDGLDDMKEITAGIFEGADNHLPDTDGDGLKDGEDPNPLDPNLPVEVQSSD